MKMQKLALYTLIGGWALVQFGCGKDDSPNDDDPTPPVETFYNVTETTINDDGYTAPGELVLLYSIDNGVNYSSEKPEDLSKGDELWVKINNGTNDITEDDFYFDWSASTPSPVDAENELAKFVVKEADLTLMASVVDKMVFVVSERSSGQFYTLDPTAEVVALTSAFTIMQGEDVLTRIRSAVYNYNDGKLYISTLKFWLTKSSLHSVNTSTMEATTLNANEEGIWEGIADLAITPDNQILATIGFGGGANPAVINFELDGTASEHVLFTGDNIPCCGLGLNQSLVSGEYLIGDGFQNPILIHKSNINGEISESVELTLEGFTNTTPDDYRLRNLVKDNSGKIYVLCNDDDGDTHIAEADLDAGKLIHIAKIGTDGENQYNAFAYIPAYIF